MTDKAIKIIGKYAVILIACYGLEFLVRLFLGHFSKTGLEVNEGLSYYIQLTLPYILNLITAIIIWKDKKDLSIDGKYSILLTLFYRPIGVVLFLIYLINNELSKKPVHNKGLV